MQMPLHYGKAPAWLFELMTRLAREISLAVVAEYGPTELLRRLSDPFWFQAFGCVLGFDWHSSGLTTTVCGALKEGLRPVAREIGVYVAGGKGKTSRKTPQEISGIGEFTEVNVQELVKASRLAAKVDSAAVQDGYQLYHHTFIFTEKNEWVVIQQGMNEANRYARRYHWLSEKVTNFACEPHTAVCSDAKSKTLNMVALESKDARLVSTELAREKPEKLVQELNYLIETLPAQHHVEIANLNPKRLKSIFLKTYELQPQNFTALLETPGVGPQTVRALSLIAELVYGAKPSWRDPARFSFAHGGKDGHPYPVNRQVYQQSIEVLRNALKKASLGKLDKLKALKRLEKMPSN